MKNLKQIAAYLIWIILSLLLGISYMRVFLGSYNSTSTGLVQVFGNLIYKHALVYVGLRGGSIIAILFILTDILFLKQKLKNNKKATSIRFLILIVITIAVGTIHYILEKVIDII